MDCKDLMVGDWVSYCGFYNKVIYIGQKVSMYNEKGTEFTTDPEYIRPIPLTEEILVKNSIKISSFTGTLYWFDEDEQCCVKPIEDRFMFMYSKGADYLTFRITYVHQLQHLLRTVGAQKEIEL